MFLLSTSDPPPKQSKLRLDCISASRQRAVFKLFVAASYRRIAAASFKNTTPATFAFCKGMIGLLKSARAFAALG